MRRILIEPAREAVVSNKQTTEIDMWTYCSANSLRRSLRKDRGYHFRPQKRAGTPIRLPREKLLTVPVEYRYGS